MHTRLLAVAAAPPTDFGLSIDITQERPVTRVGTLDYMVSQSAQLSACNSALQTETIPAPVTNPRSCNLLLLHALCVLFSYCLRC
jgi:hypothetical protein